VGVGLVFGGWGEGMVEGISEGGVGVVVGFGLGFSIKV